MTAHFAQQGGRLSAATRATSAEAGLWQCSDNRIVRIREMPDGHLVNALLKLLADGCGDPLRGGYTYAQYNTVVNTLTREVEVSRLGRTDDCRGSVEVHGGARAPIAWRDGLAGDAQERCRVG